MDKRYLGLIEEMARDGVALNYEDERKVEEQTDGVKPIVKPLLRPLTKLDKYIDLILKNVTNIDEFVYLL